MLEAPDLAVAETEVLEIQLNLKDFGLTLEQLKRIATIRMAAERISRMFARPDAFTTIDDLTRAVEISRREVECTKCSLNEASTD